MLLTASCCIGVFLLTVLALYLWTLTPDKSPDKKEDK